MYVDDEVINTLIFKKYFVKEDFEILTAQDGVKGLKVLEENPDTDIVFSDFQMPGMDGLEFISLAKMKFPEAKYSLITGLTTTPEIEEALESKLIAKFIRKPLNKNIIIKAVKEMVE